MMIHLAQCCNPVPGDSIVGYVSRGRGIIVHKSDCSNLANMPEIEQRKIDVSWELGSESLTRKFIVTSKRTQNLFSEIEGAIRNHKGHLISGNLLDEKLGNLNVTLVMKCEKEDDFKKVINAIRAIPNIIKIFSA